MMAAVHFLLCICLFAFSAPIPVGHAKDPIFLFPPNSSARPSSELVPVENYDEILQNLKPEDVLGFEDGARFEFIDYIGHGKTNHVLRVKATTGINAGKTMALRLPISRGSLWTEQAWDLSEMDGPLNGEQFNLTFSHYIDATREHAELFSRSGIGPYYYGGLKGQYNTFEVIPKVFTLDEYLSRKVRVSGEEDRAVQAALARFQRRTAGILGIQDISQPGQVIYNGMDFILVDWYGVRLIDENIYPWAFVTEGLSGNRLFKEGMFSYGLAGEVLSSYRIWVDYQSTAETRADRVWQDGLEKFLNQKHAMARLDMLESGINPLTGKAVLRPHTYWERNFGLWKTVYSEMNRTKKLRKCNRITHSEVFD